MVNIQDQVDEEAVDEELGDRGSAFGSRKHCGCARDQYPQSIEKSGCVAKTRKKKT
jgi:hypothetical protein